MTITRSQAARLSQSEGPGDAELGDAEAPQGQVGRGRGQAGAGRGGRGTRASGGRRGGTRGAAGTRTRQTDRQIESCPPQTEDPNDSFFDDPGYSEKLQARNGCLGTIGSRGWEAKTNFLIDVYALINSSAKYKLKGSCIYFFLKARVWNKRLLDLQ